MANETSGDIAILEALDEIICDGPVLIGDAARRGKAMDCVANGWAVRGPDGDFTVTAAGRDFHHAPDVRQARVERFMETFEQRGGLAASVTVPPGHLADVFRELALAWSNYGQERRLHEGDHDLIEALTGVEKAYMWRPERAKEWLQDSHSPKAEARVIELEAEVQRLKDGIGTIHDSVLPTLTAARAGVDIRVALRKLLGDYADDATKQNHSDVAPPDQTSPPV